MPWCPTLPYSLFSKFFSFTPKVQKAPVPKEEVFCEAQTLLGTLFQGLEGSRLVIPCVEALSPDWKVGVNPHLESIRSEYNSWVIQYVKYASTCQLRMFQGNST